MSAAARDTEDVAALARRLAVLLAAGTAPASAWTHVADSAGSSRRVQRVAASVAEGLSVPDAILASVRAIERKPPARQRAASQHTDAAWLAIGAAWQVASDAGAPLAGTLESVADALRDVEQTEREVATALAGPASTSKLVMVLPGIGLLFGAALGFDTITVLATTPAGWACLLIGSALLLAGRAWTRRLLGAAGRRSTTPGLELDLLAIAVGGGASVDRAREAVRAALERCQLPMGDLALAEETLDLSQRAGVPAAGLLRAEASQQRSRSRGDGARAAAKLGVTLMLPLGACILPAFVAVGVVPLMIAVISSSLGTLPA